MAVTIYPHPGRYSPEDKYIGYRVADRYTKSDRDMRIVIENL